MRKSIATVSLSGRLVEKLEAIAAASFDGRIGPSEFAIPAIRSDSGSAICFTEREIAADFETDFVLDAEAPQPALLTRIDHIAQALPEVLPR